MTNQLRVLSEDEIPCVAGGSIVVTGYPYDPWSSYMSYDQFMWMYGSYYQDPYAGYGYSGGGGSGGGGASAPNYPTGFNQQLDNSADAVAETIAAEIAAKPDDGQREYGAVLWKDANGNVHRTTVTPGTDGPDAHWDPASVWNQIDFANGGKVIGIIHSHPHQNSGTNGDTLSSRDFDLLMDPHHGAPGSASGYDNTNYRDYLVWNGAVSEYYAFDQNPAYVGLGAQATWAVESTDYGN